MCIGLNSESVFGVYRTPVYSIHPIQYENRINRNRVIENPTRIANAFKVRLVLPLSFIRKTRADPRLARMRMKATRTT